MRTPHFFATYYQQKKSALNLVQSLMMQTNPEWKLTICSNADASLLEFRDEIFKPLFGDDPRVTFDLKEENTGYWGALNRKHFIENVLQDDELLINTSVEDYYAPKTVEYIAERNENFIYWDFTHHHFGYKTTMAITQPRINKIDWGSFAVLGEYAKSVKMLPIRKTSGDSVVEEDAWINFAADGLFVEYLFNQMPFISNTRLPKILFVKN